MAAPRLRPFLSPFKKTLEGVPWVVRKTQTLRSFANALVTQDTAEVLVAPTSQKARVTQDTAEVLIKPTSQKARVTAVSVEVLTKVSPRARVTQVSVEVLQRNINETFAIVWVD